MKKHPEIGYNLLKNFDSYKEVSRIILAHQEHYDGTAYPKGLKGNNIPLIARIIGVADAYHAMTNDRPYRKALSTETAIAELLKHNGTQFDPQIVEIFISGLIEHELITGTELAEAKAKLA
jgi:HD-GYP domain-containing protein (c-di-GMP phosphodiesterase class II)